jgi:hypothetical protein
MKETQRAGRIVSEDASKAIGGSPGVEGDAGQRPNE